MNSPADCEVAWEGDGEALAVSEAPRPRQQVVCPLLHQLDPSVERIRLAGVGRCCGVRLALSNFPLGSRLLDGPDAKSGAETMHDDAPPFDVDLAELPERVRAAP